MNFSFGLAFLGVLFFNLCGCDNGLDEVGPTAELLSLGVFFSLKTKTSWNKILYVKSKNTTGLYKFSKHNRSNVIYYNITEQVRIE
jgi:hypothetical protein